MVKFKFDTFDDIGPFYRRILKKAGLETVDDFLNKSSYGLDCKSLLAKLQAIEEKEKEGKQDHPNIDEKRLVKWCQIFDLFRVPRLPPRIAELLVCADIKSVRELSYMDPAQVMFKMREVDEDTHFIVIEEPKIDDVEQWIYYAKLMTRRKKFGLDIPLINVIPMMTLDYASELQNYKIWTIEDLDANIALVPSLYGRIGMPRPDYIAMLGICDLCRVNGIDLGIARALYMTGIRSILAFMDASLDELHENLRKLMATSTLGKEYPTLEQDFTRDRLEQLQQAALFHKTSTFLEVIT